MHKFNLADCPLIEVPLNEVVLYKNNARLHNDEQLDMIEASFRKFGVVTPVLLTENKEVIAGHARVIVARRMGMTAISAIILPHLTEAQIKAYRIADNAIALKGEWSIDLLAQEIELIATMDVTFEPIEIGFVTGEIDFMISSVADKPAPKAAAEVVLNPLRGSPAISRLGDIWNIGAHRIICGDARERDVYDGLMQGRLADAVISDQPWNIKVDGFISGLGKTVHPEFPMASGEMTPEEFLGFTRQVLANQRAVSKPGALCFQFIDWRSVDVMIRAGKAEIGDLVNICIWVKQTGGMGSLWRSQHEMICVFRVPGAKSLNNVQLGKHGRYRTNIWSYQSPSGFGSERKKLKMHPTAKNEKMIADAIMDCTNRNDLVLDAFLGSGTTLLTAHMTGRIGAGIELDPYYVDLAVNRLCEAVGENACLDDGRDFETVRTERMADEGE